MSEPVYDGGTPHTEFSTTDGVIDYGSLAGQVRLYITDTNDDPALRLFTDAQLTVFLNKWLPGLTDKLVYNVMAKEKDSPLK